MNFTHGKTILVQKSTSLTCMCEMLTVIGKCTMTKNKKPSFKKCTFSRGKEGGTRKCDCAMRIGNGEERHGFQIGKV